MPPIYFIYKVKDEPCAIYAINDLPVGLVDFRKVEVDVDCGGGVAH